MKRYKRVLTIAGSDSGSGAGIQADLKTFAALECFGTTVVTAITAQNTLGIQSIYPLPATVVAAQIDAILSDIGCDAIKIGMVYEREIIEMIHQKLSAIPPLPIVLDPVIYAKGGISVLKKEAIRAIKHLFSLSLLITPNLTEASLLLDYPVETEKQMEKAALDLLQMGANNVLLKGGHLSEGKGNDCFCSKNGEISWLKHPEVNTCNHHGTGCTLSSAIAAFLTREYTLKDAIQAAKRFLHATLLAGKDYRLGSGHGPLHHFYAFWRET
jgi:hydroxymethylpyrimidine/phosphomethylpyrimidine kinase